MVLSILMHFGCDRGTGAQFICARISFVYIHVTSFSGVSAFFQSIQMVPRKKCCYHGSKHQHQQRFSLHYKSHSEINNTSSTLIISSILCIHLNS
mmetsp:Transcript_54274/g.162452  ORF Transcript_54274/g.162452 Transcript_54274/m.162452 type:complete len:95 (-) Transcript_54274:82-366(-)